MAKTNYTKYIILGLLSTEPMSGYEIRKWVKDTISYLMMDFSYGQIYPALSMLERTGLAVMSEETTGGGRSRKTYQITDKGLEDLQAWLLGPDQGEYELLLKMCFGNLIPPGELIKKLEVYRQKREKDIAYLGEWLKAVESGPICGPATPYYEMITRLGLKYFVEEKVWCGESIEILKKLNGEEQ